MEVRAVGYLRVSTDEQVDSGAGLAAQRAAIEMEASKRDWTLRVVEEGASAKDLKRPVLTAVLQSLDSGGAQVLVVTKVDRLSRSVGDFAQLLDRARAKGWSLVCLDLGVDTTTPSGELMANVVVSAAQYERRLIGARTRDALAVRKAEGVRLGRPPVLSRGTVQRIVEERRGGATLTSIARGLDEQQVPTAQGGRWWPSTVAAVLRGQEARKCAGAAEAASCR